MTERKSGSLENSIFQGQEVLLKAMNESASEDERLAYSLRLVIEPAWSTWIKESGATTQQIAHAIIELSANLMAETIKNIAKPGQVETLAKVMGKSVCDRTLYYATVAPVLAEIDGFHRTDA